MHSPCWGGWYFVLFSHFFSGLLSPEPCATFSYHRNVDGRAPADQKGLKTLRMSRPHGIFSIFKLCNEVQGLRFWGTMIRRPGWDHDWGCRLGTISGGHFLPFPQGWGVIFLEGCYGFTIGIKPTSAERLGAKCGGGMAFIKQNQLI